MDNQEIPFPHSSFFEFDNILVIENGPVEQNNLLVYKIYLKYNHN